MRRYLSLAQWTGLLIAGFLMCSLLLASQTMASEFDDEFGDDFDEDFEDSGDTPIADNSETAEVAPLGPFGGDLWDVAVDPTNGMVYTVAKDSPNGMYRSSDSGATWTGLSGVDLGGGVAIEVDPASGEVFVAFANGLYKSVDLGETFTQINEDSGNAMLYANSTLVVGSYSTNDTVLVSTDNGVSFESVTFASSGDQFVWDVDYSAADDTWFVLAFDTIEIAHLYQSTDGAAIWTEVGIPEITSSEGKFAVNPDDVANMVITGGFTGNAYYTVTGESGWIETDVQSTGVSFDQTGRVWVGEQYSDDGGASWEGYDDDSTTTAIGGHNITVDPSDENIVYADAMPGLSQSTDRGATWSDINVGISAVTITDIAQAENKDVVWAAAYNGIAKTENFTSGDPTWQFPVLEEPGMGIWTDPANPDVVVVGIIGGILRSTDGGETWSANLVEGLIDSRMNVDEIISDVSDSNTLYAAVSNGDPDEPKAGHVLQSTDQGETWSSLQLLDSGSAQTISQASDGTIYVGIGTESEIEGTNGIYKYSSGTWEALDNGPDEDIVKIIVDPNDDNVIYAIAGVLYSSGFGNTGFGFYKSEDAGDTWTQITEGLTDMQNFTSLAVQASTDPTTLYLGTTNIYGQGTLLKSSDGGTTWGVLYTGLQDETFYTLIFDGVTLGSSRGMYDIKSKASLSLKKGAVVKKTNKQLLKATLKDAVTDKFLKKQTVRLMKKTNSGFKLIKTEKTDKKGKAEFAVTRTAKKAVKYKIQWKPKNDYADEYIAVTSSQVSVKAKK